MMQLRKATAPLMIIGLLAAAAATAAVATRVGLSLDTGDFVNGGGTTDNAHYVLENTVGGNFVATDASANATYGLQSGIALVPVEKDLTAFEGWVVE